MRTWLPRALVYVVAIVISLFVLAPLYIITIAAFSTE
jgi:ABC-type glycerol-3-phosphate transport system permease component